jgi:AsmA protein
MQRHSSNKPQPRSRALVPVPKSLPAASRRLSAAELSAGFSKQPRRRGLWRVGLTVACGAAAAIAIVLGAVNLFAPSKWVEARVVSLLKEYTGRDLVVNGVTRLTFSPFPHIVMTDAVISKPDAAPHDSKLEVSKLEIDLGLFEVFGAPEKIERIVFDRPVLSLSADGPSTPETLRLDTVRGSGSADAARELAIEEVLVHDGTVLVHSARRSVPRRFERVNATLSVPGTTTPMVGSGQANWKGKAIEVDFKLASLAALADQNATQLELAIAADILSMRYEGNIATVPRLSGRGALSAKTRSVRQLLAWLKGVSGAVPVSGEGEMMGAVAWTGDDIALSDIRFEQENARGGGRATLEWVEPRPRIEGTFIVDQLNLAPVLALAGRGVSSVAATAFPTAPMSANQPEGQMASDAASTKPSTQVEHAIVPPPSPETATSGPRLLKPGPGVSQPSLTISLPQAEIDQVLAASAPSTTAEPLFDADLDLDIRQAQLDDVRIGPSAVSLAFVDGKLDATVWRMAFYGGEGRGTLTVAMRNAVPSFDGDLRLEDVDTRSLLRDALGWQRMGGKGKLTLNVSGKGGDWEAMALSLMGNGAFAVSDGAIDGIAAPALVSGLEAGTLDLRPDPKAVLPFALLAGSFDINHGVASTHNLRLRSALANITADGGVNLARDSLDLTVSPGPVAKDQGGGVVSLAEHLPPLRIVGSLQSPRMSLASNPLAAVDAKPTADSDLVLPGLVLRERRGTKRRNQVTSGGVAAGQTQQPSALAPSFSTGPQDTVQSPPLRLEPQR